MPTTTKRTAAQPMKPTARAIAREELKPLCWFHLSFASEFECLGSVIVKAHGPLTAEQRATELGIHKGGEILTTPLDASDMAMIPGDMLDRWISPQEMTERLDAKGVGE